jgi:hypothetical protein
MMPTPIAPETMEAKVMNMGPLLWDKQKTSSASVYVNGIS